MYKILSILFLIGIGSSSFSQKVRVTGYNKDFEKLRDSQHFDYVHQDFDGTKLIWVANIKVSFDTVIPGMIGESYFELKDRANQFGANAYKILASDIYKIGQDKFIEIGVYWIRMEDRNENLLLHHSHSIYVFGFLGFHQDIPGYDVKVQETEFVMQSLTYKVSTFPVKTKVTVQLGTNSRGSKVECYIEERMFPKFYYFNMVKGSFKNAWIDEYSLSYGVFLSKILRKG